MPVLSFILFIAACVGHIAILAFSNNWWFGLALPHRLLGALRAIHGLLVVAGVTAFVWAYSAGSLFSPLQMPSSSMSMVATAYTMLCALVGLVWLPIISVIRGLRARPLILQSNHTHVLNVAADLGCKPFGRGKYRALAHLPGNQAFQVDLSVKTLALSGIPAAWDGLSILHVSDLHLCGSPDKIFYQRVMEACQQWEPDLVAFTGDLVDTHNHYRWILPVLGRLPPRIASLAILGNHDSWHEPRVLRRRLRRCGYRVLDNRWEQIEVRGLPMIVIGHEGPWFKPPPDLTDCPEGIFRLLLSHTPDNIRWAREHHVGLMLSGHNHGGQIRFPLVGSVLVPSSYGRRYDCGVFDEPPTA